MSLFDELFVLEMATNHLGCLDRGIAIVKAFAPVVRQHGVKAAFKLQFRDVPKFVHKDHFNDQTRYVRKTIDAGMSWFDYITLTKVIREEGMLLGATPFDEVSVSRCVDAGVDFVKVASSDINDWTLLEAIGETRKPVIVSTGGASRTAVKAAVDLFEVRSVPLALNHCVSLYPSGEADLCLNQIDVLRREFPGITIGWSSHEDSFAWGDSLCISYAKGARLWERHVDIIHGGHLPAAYSCQPLELEGWFERLKTAKTMCGDFPRWRPVSKRETSYLRELHRGRYARRDLSPGERLTEDNSYLAIPAEDGQLTCNDVIGARKIKDRYIPKDSPVRRNDVE